MNFERQTIQPKEKALETPEKIEKSGGLAHKIFEAGAEGGKKLKNTLRALTLVVALSPAFGAGVEARAGQIEKPKQDETPIVKVEKSEKTTEYNKLTPEQRRELEMAGDLIPSDNELAHRLENGSIDISNLTPAERDFLIKKEILIPASKQKENIKLDKNSDAEIKESENVDRNIPRYPTLSDIKERIKQDEYKEKQDALKEKQDALKAGKEYVEFLERQKLLKLEREKMNLEKMRMLYEYNFLHQLINNENIQLNFVVPVIPLVNQEKQIINHMYQEQRLNVPQLLGIIGRYDANFSNKWIMIGNMLKQGVDYNGNQLSEQRLEVAKNNYFKALHYIAGELCR